MEAKKSDRLNLKKLQSPDEMESGNLIGAPSVVYWHGFIMIYMLFLLLSLVTLLLFFVLLLLFIHVVCPYFPHIMLAVMSCEFNRGKETTYQMDTHIG